MMDEMVASEPTSAADAGRGFNTSTLTISDAVGGWTMPLPANWVVADLDDPSWLDTIGDTLLAAVALWAMETSESLGEPLDLPEPGDDLIEIVSGAQASIVSGFRNLTDDLAPSALIYGLDVVGPEAEVLTTVCSISVVDSEHPSTPASRDVYASDLETDDGATLQVAVGEWEIPTTDGVSRLVVRGVAQGAAAGQILDVLEYIAENATTIEGASSE